MLRLSRTLTFALIGLAPCFASASGGQSREEREMLKAIMDEAPKFDLYAFRLTEPLEQREGTRCQTASYYQARFEAASSGGTARGLACAIPSNEAHAVNAYLLMDP